MTPAEAAGRLLLDSGADLLPADPSAMLRKEGFRLRGYAMLMAWHGLSWQEIADAVQSREGATLFDVRHTEKTVVAFNDCHRDSSRTRYTLAHELGHAALGHLDMEAGKAKAFEPDPELEDAADSFADNLLCPVPVLRRLKPGLTAERACGIFDYPLKLWRRRLQRAERDEAELTTETAEALRRRFTPWMNGRECRICGGLWQKREDMAERCPLCGSAEVRWCRRKIAPAEPVKEFLL